MRLTMSTQYGTLVVEVKYGKDYYDKAIQGESC